MPISFSLSPLLALWKRYKAKQAFHAGLKALTMNDEFSAVMQFRADELEWLGLMEKTGGERPEYRFTEFGNKFICAHPRPGDLWEALERLRHVREQRTSNKEYTLLGLPGVTHWLSLKPNWRLPLGRLRQPKLGRLRQSNA